jgi:predicted nucleic acid binding AN1-type Zn finger protein
MKLEINFSLDRDKKKLFEVLKMLKQETYIVTIEKKKNKRSLSANAYYWVLISIMEKETGQDSDSLHDYFKTKFLPPRKVVFRQTGEEKAVQGSTASLDSFDFFEYIDKIRAFAIQELDIYLPTP